MIPLQKSHSQSRHKKKDQKSKERDLQEESEEKRTAVKCLESTEKSQNEENASALSSSAEQNPTPPSPARTSSSPVVLPKSVKAMTRKMENDFLAKKASSSPPLSPNRRTNRQNGSANSTTSPLSVALSANCVNPPSINPATFSVISSPKSQLKKAQSFNVHSSTTDKVHSTTRSMTGVPVKRKSPLYRTSSSAFAQPQPVDSITTKTASQGKNTKGQSTKSRGTMPERMVSSVLISKESQYKRLIRTRSEDSKSVRVLAGPHFSFHVT